MDLIINPIVTTRRRTKSDNSYLHNYTDNRSHGVESKNRYVQEIDRTIDKYKLPQNIINLFEFKNVSLDNELHLESNNVFEFTTNVNQGTVISSISKKFSISLDENEYLFSGVSLKSICCLHLLNKPVEFKREIGYIVTLNRFYQFCYGTEKYSKEHVSKLFKNEKEVLISTEKIHPFYSNESLFSINAGELPPHNVELEMNYSPRVYLKSIKNGIDLSEISINDNLFIYITIRLENGDDNWIYCPLHTFQLNSVVSFDGKNQLMNSNKVWITSHQDTREFPLNVLSNPNLENGEFVISKNSRNNQINIESYPCKMMDFNEEEFHKKVKDKLMNDNR